MYKRITAADSPYSLVADENFSTGAIDCVYIDCDSTLGPITILLPAVKDCPFFKPTVYVNDVSGTAQTNNITVTPDAANVDLIDGQHVNVKIDQNKGSIKLEMVDLKESNNVGYWMGVFSDFYTGAQPLKNGLK